MDDWMRSPICVRRLCMTVGESASERNGKFPLAMAAILLATASYDRSIKLWRVNPVEQTRSLSFSQESQVNCLAVSSDRTRLAAAGFMSIKVYDLSALTGDSGHGAQAQAVISASQENTHTGNVTSLGFVRSTQGANMLFSTSEDGTWRLWDTRTPVLRLKRSVDVKEPINCGALLFNSMIVCGTQLGTLGVWNFFASQTADSAATSGPVKPNPDGLIDSVSIQSDDPAIRSVTLSPGGDVAIAAANTGRIYVFAISKAVLPAQQRPAASTPAAEKDAAPADGSGSATAAPQPAAAADGDTSGEAPNASGEANTRLTAPASPRAPSDVPNTSIVTANTDNKHAGPHQHVRGSRGLLTLLWTFEAHSRYVLKCSLSPSGSMLCTTSADCTAALWRVPEDLPKLAADGNAPAEPRTEKWPLVRSITGHQRWVWDCAFSRCGNYVVTASSDHTGRLWHVETGKLEATFAGHQKPVTCIVLDDRRE
jgi:WD40 repeat protein